MVQKHPMALLFCWEEARRLLGPSSRPHTPLVRQQLCSKIQAAAEDGTGDSPSRWRAMHTGDKMDIWAFAPFLCLPVVSEFKGLPIRQKPPPASLQRNTGRQHTAAVSTQVIMWLTQPITGQRSQVSPAKYTEAILSEKSTC